MKKFFEKLAGVDILAFSAILACLLLQQFAATAMIVVMYLGGRFLENYATRKAKRELTELLKKRPKQARLKNGEQIIVEKLKINDEIIIKPGEIVPADAEIIKITNRAGLDNSLLTGESKIIELGVKDKILSGSVVVGDDCIIFAKVVQIAENSQYAQIVKLVKRAEKRPAKFMRLANTYAVPFTVVSYIIAGFAWLASGDALRFAEVLVVASPCPLILATPIAIISGLSRAARHGIIMKDGGALEKLAKIKAIGFDKTGTLTWGRLNEKHDDSLRPGIKKMISELKKYNLKTAAFSGDKTEVANKIGAQAGIDEIFAELLPGDKIKMLQKLPKPFAFVGDGANDAPSLAAASVGIAVANQNATIAAEAADIVLMNGDTPEVLHAYQISRQTMKIGMQSAIIGIGSCLILEIIAGFGYIPAFYGAVLQEVIDIAVILNALRAHLK